MINLHGRIYAVSTSSSLVDQPCLDPQNAHCQDLAGAAQVFYHSSQLVCDWLILNIVVCLCLDRQLIKSKGELQPPVPFSVSIFDWRAGILLCASLSAFTTIGSFPPLLPLPRLGCRYIFFHMFWNWSHLGLSFNQVDRNGM